jgi:hypothetical protein
MNIAPSARGPDAAGAAEKRPYRKPHLVVHGNVADITGFGGRRIRERVWPNGRLRESS